MLRHLPLVVLLACGAVAGTVEKPSVPLFFMENRGQAGPAVRFVAQGSGLIAYFSSREILFRLADRELRLQLIGAGSAGSIEGVRRLKAEANFLTGAPHQWRTGVHLYEAVRYRELYPAIDMIYGADGRNLKSEFVLGPGADPARIRLRYGGAGTVRVGQDGALRISAEGREFREEPPVAYQQRGSRRVSVRARFNIGPDETVGFIVNGYDPELPLVIDPTISYSTLLGGSTSNAAMALAVDSTGAAYLAGFTASVNFPTVNPVQNLNGGGNDVFVAKLGPTGNALVYATYIGGVGDDRAYGIAVDSTGAAYVAGATASTNFPVWHSYQATLAGTRNAFALKLNPAGNALVYSTYLGGTAADGANAIAVNAAGNAFITGDATSSNFPATGFQKVNHGTQNVFAAKLSADGTHIVYSTYLGGSGTDHGAGIALDSNSEAYVTGSTWSTDFPVANAWQPQLAGGQDAFVAKLSADGSSLLFSTFLGGSGGSLGYPEGGQGIAVDGQGNAYVAGVTGSSDFPLLNAFQGTKVGLSTDAFVAEFNSTGTLVYSTYLGGSGMDAANAIAVDGSGSAYVVGQTLSSDLAVINAAQSTPGGDYDAFWAVIAPAGNTLSALSYLGGNGSDTATSVALDSAGNLYIAGWTLSTNFPVLNAYQTINGGNYSAFVSKIALSTGPPVAVSVTPSSGSGASQTFSFLYTDPKGFATIASTQIIINGTLSTATGCYLFYNRAANSVYLTNDAGTAWQGPLALGQTGALQNSQCSVNAANSSASGSGNNLTLNLTLSFQPAFAGSRNVYMEVYDGSADSGWQQRGAWTVPSSGPPAAVSVTPSSGSGSSQAFSFLFSDPSGYATIASTQIIINGALSTANGCYMYYSRSANTLYLTNDAGTAWQSPVQLGQSGTLQNSQCSVNAAASSASGSGNNLTLNLALTFQAAFAGARNVYMEVYDGAADSGWQQRGTWTIPSGGSPSAVSVTPGSGTGAGQTFSFLFSDPSGFAAIASTQVIVNGALSTANGCYMYYSRSANTLYLTNDAGTAWQSPVALGQSGTLQNSQCSIAAASSSASAAGNNLTLNLAITFQVSFAGNKNVYMEVYDGAADSGWQQRGTWTVSTSGSTGPSVPVTPPPGGSQAVSLQFTDPSGHMTISAAQAIINSQLASAGGCYIYYQRDIDSIYLANDAATAWQGSQALGQPGALQNSQCTIEGLNSSSSINGNTLMLSLSSTFSQAFAGAKTIWVDLAGALGNSGWQQLGVITVP